VTAKIEQEVSCISLASLANPIQTCSYLFKVWKAGNKIVSLSVNVELQIRDITAELRPPLGRQAEHHTHIGKKRKPMNWFSYGYHGWLYCLWARAHDGV